MFGNTNTRFDSASESDKTKPIHQSEDDFELAQNPGRVLIDMMRKQIISRLIYSDLVIGIFS